MRYQLFITLIFLSFFINGCASKHADPKITMKPPKYVEELPSKEKIEEPIAQGSLFGRGKNPLFSDRKAMEVNDILTVIISESLSQSSSSAKKVAKDNTNSLGGGLFSGGGGVVSNVANNLNKATNIKFSSNTSNSFAATGTQSRDESFKTTISARVIKIMNNGNYFIEGSREILLNGEKQMVQISGVIRPYDIDQSNTIDSKYIADAKILYKSEGDIANSAEKSWGTKVVENIWPF